MNKKDYYSILGLKRGVTPAEIKRVFRDHPDGPRENANTIYDILLDPTEALWGTEREILVERGWETQRVIIRIPARVKDGTLLSLSLEGQDVMEGTRSTFG